MSLFIFFFKVSFVKIKFNGLNIFENIKYNLLVRKKKREIKPLSDLILNENRRNEKIVLIISEYTACVMFVACDL